MDTTLTSIFDSHKEALAEKLTNFSLPRDSREVEKTVAEFLSDMFESDGSYRQSLTQSEDYILQSAIQLLRAQQSIAAEIASMASSLNVAPKLVSEPQVHANPYVTVAGTGIGVVAGSFMGTWAAICGAIAGTAIAVYLSTGKKKASATEDANVVRTINVNAFINIVRKICESIDNLMETFRVQVKRVQNSYEQKEEASLLTTYSTLMENVAYVIKMVKANEDGVEPKLRTAIEIMEASLGNYGLKYANGKIIND